MVADSVAEARELNNFFKQFLHLLDRLVEKDSTANNVFKAPFGPTMPIRSPF